MKKNKKSAKSTTKTSTKKAVAKTDSKKIFGHIRPNDGTGVIAQKLATGKMVTWKEIDSLAKKFGVKGKQRIYRLSRLGRETKLFIIETNDNGVKLIYSKSSKKASKKTA